jgi:predicted N-acetyltransferase YhbS
MSDYAIRSETLEDRAEVARLIARTYLAEGAKVISTTSQLRDLAEYDSDLGVLAEQNGKGAAYALFTPVKVDDADKVGVMMAPLAVDTALEAFDLADFLGKAADKVKEKGFRYVFALGDADDMAAAGFEKADTIGLTLDAESAGTFLVKDLTPEAGDKVVGQVKCPEVLK